MTVTLVFMVLALICFIVAAAKRDFASVDFTALGLAFYVLAVLLSNSA